ncbi:N-acetyltransferase [Thermobispora bispora]|jgi:GNAT superfamily N-acetyltransferase|uniref:GCN5-related N-acetyltransferase n=1 Tax=Thermobispora bispora (strain ATCC 19993 / DSM 43833 / CBS 139.67 / JCM 10125 / KCTC 9307 / NBRC 14880 / R51) TaxID=469371 RepID=D6YAB8_THEBD|nr:GNAT family N-acetyltransferase [Thermobispora bispora]MBO2473228.1 N-acetyltransferase [Actinomycetales bacterium]MDI9580039.1 GNAT family N-acetyltransferase [Thermobispora sp.]ADG90171.1 GCN5-related N-acetyltransferase [Thermobispora bispora DSM 43833]MBX6167339.1 GNAT family N-acetyltransferase [Thermobispora bispora]QSI46609.1 N-acetyltransferase [Thermobispora bispora]
MADVEFVRATGEAAERACSDEYADAYTEIYAEPPYHSGPLYSRDRYLERTRRQVRSEGFELVSAIDAATGELAGFCFGLTFPPGSWWAGQVSDPPAEVLTAPKVAVIELILRKPYRGRGYGRRLLAEFLAGRSEPYAMLLSHPQAPAHAMYEHWGWRVVGTCRPVPDADLLDVMVLDRRGG